MSVITSNQSDNYISFRNNERKWRKSGEVLLNNSSTHQYLVKTNNEIKNLYYDRTSSKTWNLKLRALEKSLDFTMTTWSNSYGKRDVRGGVLNVHVCFERQYKNRPIYKNHPLQIDRPQILEANYRVWLTPEVVMLKHQQLLKSWHQD